ncbi:MAG: FkbM family methyltransferase [Paracoccaceae bacterium]
MHFNHNLQEIVSSDIEALKLTENDGIVVDVGAGYGGQILQYLKIVSANQIYAFEPLPHNIDILLQNVTENINFYPYACGPENKTVRLEVPDFTPAKGRLDRNGVRSDYNGGSYVGELALPSLLRSNTSSIFVDQVRLDSFLPPGNIRLLKIDVQGYEEQVLKGLGNKLQDVQIAYIEYSPERVDAAVYMRDNGFEIYDSKYIILGPPNGEEILKGIGFSQIFGFTNSAGRYRYDCSLTDQLYDEDVFNLTLPKGFRVNETDLICIRADINQKIVQQLRN